jgi:hypothetical protein
MSSNNTKTFGYETDNGDVPPIFSDRYSDNPNDNNSNEKDPIYRSNDHSLPTLEQVRTEALNVLARQQYSSSSSSRFHDDIKLSSSSHDDYKYSFNNSGGSSKKNRRRFKLVMLAITCFVAAIVTITVIVSTSKKSNSSSSLVENQQQKNSNDVDFTTDDNTNNNNENEVENNTKPDDLGGTTGDDDTKKRNAIKTLLQIKISHLHDMETIDTPQYKAIEWLVQNTNSINDIPVPDTNNNINYDTSYQFIQTYIAVLLYYSLDGPNWYNDCNFLSSELNVCDWNTRTNRNNTQSNTDDYIFGIRCHTSYNDGSVRDDEITHFFLRKYIYENFFSLVSIFFFNVSSGIIIKKNFEIDIFAHSYIFLIYINFINFILL